MAQRKQLTWTELRVGLFVLVALFLAAIAIFYVTGQGILGPKYRLITYLSEVEGLQSGAPVRLDGVPVGSVQSISLTDKPSDASHNITLVLRIDKKFQPDIRTDSTASLITEGLLGNRYVTVTRGITGTPIPNNGVIPGKEEAAMKEIVERGADLVQNLSALSNDVGDIVDKVKAGQGTIGKLLTDPGLYNHLNETAAKLNSVAEQIKEGQGTLGKVVSSDELYNKANATLSSVQDVVTAVKEQKGTIGKLVYDPAVYEDAKGLVANGNAMLSDIRAGKGTAGKLVTDDALYNNLRDASANVRDVSAKLNSTEGTMGKFFSDPKLYDNLTGVTGDMRLLISDFRQNPKKFLHVKLAVF